MANLDQDATTSVLTRKIVTDNEPRQSLTKLNLSENENEKPPFDLKHRKILEFEFKSILDFICEFIFLTLLFLCTALWPSVLAIVYLIFFLFLMTKWSLICNDSEQLKTMRTIKMILIIYTALHILVYYLYQFNLFQNVIQSDNLYARLFGLNRVIYTKCEQPAHLYFANDLKWQQIVYPFILFLLYWFLAIEFSYKHEKVEYKKTIPRTTSNRNDPNNIITTTAEQKVLLQIIFNFEFKTN